VTDQIDPALVVLTGVGAFAAFRSFSGAGGDRGNDGDEKNGGDKGVARTSKFINKFGSVTRAREGDRLAPDRVDDDAPDPESNPPENRQQESSGSGDGSSGGFEKSGRGDALAGVAETEEFINESGSVTRAREGDRLAPDRVDDDAPDPEPDGDLSMSDLSEADQQLLQQAGKDISDLDAGTREFLKAGGELSGDAATASTVFSDDETGTLGGPDAPGEVDLRATGDGGFVVGEGADSGQGGPPSDSDDDAPDPEPDPPKNRQQESSGSGDGSSSSGGFEKSGRGDPLAGVAATEEFINESGSVTRKRSGDPLSESASDPEPDPPKEGGDVRLRNAASSSSSSGSDDSASDPEPNVDEEDVGLSVPGTDDRVFSVTRRR